MDAGPERGFHRKHGLICPLDALQVAAWIAVAASLTYFVGLTWPFLPARETAFWAVLYLGCWGIGIILFAIVTMTEHRLPKTLSPDHSRYCDYCKENVPVLAKHCRRCNRCRCGFDHHCRFINNCVTSANYRVFFFGCLFLLSAWSLAIASSSEAPPRPSLTSAPSLRG
jgi:hypothetical protein